MFEIPHVLFQQINCSAPGVLRKASLGDSIETFNDRVKEESYRVIGDHLNNLQQAGVNSSNSIIEFCMIL